MSSPLPGDAHWVGVMQFEPERCRMEYRSVAVVDGQDEVLFAVGDDVALGGTIVKFGRIVNLFQATEKMACIAEWLPVDGATDGVAILDPTDTVNVMVSSFAGRVEVLPRDAVDNGETCACCFLKGSNYRIVSPCSHEDLLAHVTKSASRAARSWAQGVISRINSIIVEAECHAPKCSMFNPGKKKETHFEGSELARRLLGPLIAPHPVDASPPRAAIKLLPASPKSGSERKRQRSRSPDNVARQLGRTNEAEMHPIDGHHHQQQFENNAPTPQRENHCDAVQRAALPVDTADWTTDTKFLLEVQRETADCVAHLLFALADTTRHAHKLPAPQNTERQVFAHPSLTEQHGQEKARTILTISPETIQACYSRKAV